MNFELAPATKEDAPIIARLWPLYQYDLSESGGLPVNAYGLFEENSVQEHDYHGGLLWWWDHADSVFPFLMRVDGRAAGFAVAGAAPLFAPAGRDYCLHEFFLLRGFRRHGFADRAAIEIFTPRPGLWSLETLPDNAQAQAFWRKTLEKFAGKYHEILEEDGVTFEFLVTA